MAKIRQSKFTKSARGEPCTVRMYPHCNRDPQTTVLTHINCDDKGISKKSPDWWSCYACSNCHDIIDGRANVELDCDLNQAILDAIYRTHKRFIEKGLIRI